MSYQCYLRIAMDLREENNNEISLTEALMAIQASKLGSIERSMDELNKSMDELNSKVDTIQSDISNNPVLGTGNSY